MKYSLITLFTFFTIFLSAQSFSARVIDQQQNPIAFATVQTGKNTGVITNEEGYFTIAIDDLNSNSLRFSCLGFAPKTLTIDTIKKNNGIVVLDEFIDQLDQVNITGSTLNGDSIIAKVNRRLKDNYVNENIKYKLFSRSTSYMDFKDMGVEISKASGLKKKQLIGVNQGLDSLAQSVINNKAVYFVDYLANLHLHNKENSKLEVIKATELVDQNQNVTLDQLQENAQRLFLKYLDTTKTYKLKTGIIKIEDSLSLNYEADESEAKNEYTVEYLRNETHELLHKSQIYDNTTLRRIIDPDLYKYSIADVTFFNNELIYIINFEPRKAKAKFAGKLYVTDDSFAVVKIDYGFGKGKRGQKFNLKLLLGVKYIENMKRGTIIFKKNDNNSYQLQYIKEEYGNYFYLNRPLKFIENSPQKRKVGFKFLVEGDVREKNELLFISEEELSKEAFDAFTEKEKTPYQILSSYDPEIWKSYNALEPLNEMKEFKAEDK